MSVSATAQRLVDALVSVYPECMREGLDRLDIDLDPELEAAETAATEQLRKGLEELLGQPFTQQRRGPLEVFQAAFSGPTAILVSRGMSPLDRDETTVNALPGDVFGLAPASSREISDEIFEAHMSWGIEKAKAMRGLVMGRVLGFEKTGEGDSVVVFIHGFPLDHRMWLPLSSVIGERHRCLIVDLSGRGRSELDAASSIGGHAADVLATMDQIGVDDFHLVGLSMGGYIALALAEVAPHRLRSLTLADTRSGADDEKGREARVAMIQRIADGEAAEVVGGMADNLLASSTPEAIRELVLTMGLATPVETLIADVTAIRDRPDRSSVLGDLSIPVMVVVGAEDAITPPDEAETMARSVGARYEVIGEAGHLAPLEKPTEIAEALLDFWSD